MAEGEVEMELEDFTYLLKVREKKQKEGEAVEEIKRRYAEEIEALKAAFKEEIEKAKEEAYRRGFEDGYKKASEEWERELSRVKEESRKELLKERLRLKEALQEVEREKRERLRELERLIVNSLGEILEFLYIHPSNSAYVGEKISRLIDEFSQEELLTLEVGEGLAEVISGENVRVNGELGANDFRIVFKNFSVESDFKEKVNLLREEIEREIKETP